LSHAHLIFSVAGFRPGRRGPFVSAKGPKTSAAPSGLIKMGRTRALGGGLTRCAQTKSAGS
ncbi:MAG: hypothetical protein KC587_09890, partial [Nitrospira sp.]|nr:hypothetical protein [Nitrospira sp.]